MSRFTRARQALLAVLLAAFTFPMVACGHSHYYGHSTHHVYVHHVVVHHVVVHHVYVHHHY